MSKNDENVTLSKELSPLNVWSLALGCIIGWGAFVMPGNTFLGHAGTLGTVIAIGLACLIMIIIALNYSYMINRFPVVGGEFAYTKKIFGIKHAYICAWFLSLSYLAIVPLNATALALIGRNLMGGVFQFGFHYNVAGYEVYCGELILAIVALVIFAVLGIKGGKSSGKFQTILAFSLVGGVALIAGVAMFSSKATIDNLSPLFYPGESVISGIAAVVAVAPWAFVGFETIPQAAEEFNFSPQKSKIIMIFSILFGGAVYVILNTVTASVVPEEYESWVMYINDLHNLEGLISLPTFYAAEQLLGNIGLILIGISVLAAILSGVNGFYMATSRLLYSMAKENVLPKWFGNLHPKYKTPVNAILFVMVIGIIAPFFGRTALNWIVDMSSIGAAIGFGYTSAASLKVSIQEKDSKIILTSILGSMFSILFIVLLLVPIPKMNCSLGVESYICLAVWGILGIIFYRISKNHSSI